MKYRTLWIVVPLVLLALLACQPASKSTVEPTAPSTQEVVATEPPSQEATKETVMPTEVPSPEEEATEEATVEPTKEAAEVGPSTGDEKPAIFDLENLDSYRLRATVRFETEDGTEKYAMVTTETWSRAEMARRMVMEMAQGGDEAAPVMESVIIGDRAWINIGGVWMEAQEGDGDLEDSIAQGWSEVLAQVGGWKLVGEETVNGIRCKRYVIAEENPLTVTDPETGERVQVQGEVWVADDPSMLPVIVRERLRIMGGRVEMPSAAATEPPAEQKGVLHFEYDLIEVNQPVTIEPPHDVMEMPTMPPISDDEHDDAPKLDDMGDEHPEPGDMEDHPEPGDDGGDHPEPGDDGGDHMEPGDDGDDHPEPGDDGGDHPEPGEGEGDH